MAVTKRSWSRLTTFLTSEAETSTVLSFQQIERILGHALPASARRHAAFWSNASGYSFAWRDAGREVSRRDLLAEQIRFLRRHVVSDALRAQIESPPLNLAEQTSGVASGLIDDAPGAGIDDAGIGIDHAYGAGTEQDVSVLLLGGVRLKASSQQMAKDLYVSDLFGKRRRYADERALPWFVLSAEHGLLRPHDLVAPYDMVLKFQPASYRRAWGAWVLERLRHELGGLDGLLLEVHAGDAHAEALVEPSSAAGATLVRPLQGLKKGEQRAWYLSHSGSPSGSVSIPYAEVLAGAAMGETPAGEDVDAFATWLRDVTHATRLEQLDESHVPSAPGLYAWWVDEPGALALSSGLGHQVDAGLIYVGQSGATLWPGGHRSASTLRGRLIGMYGEGSVNFSTFRRRLAASLNLVTAGKGDESALTDWMRLHLALAWRGSDDADGLAAVRDEVLEQLDPVLNVQGMQGTDVRLELNARRSKRGALAAPALTKPTTPVEE